MISCRDRQGLLVHRTRAQESELPHEVSINFIESAIDFRSLSVASRRLSGASKREARIEVAAVMPRETGQRLADIALQESWIARDAIAFTLKPSRLPLEIGDVVRYGATGSDRLLPYFSHHRRTCAQGHCQGDRNPRSTTRRRA